MHELHDLNDPMAWDWNLVKNHDFSLGSVKVLGNQLGHLTPSGALCLLSNSRRSRRS